MLDYEQIALEMIERLRDKQDHQLRMRLDEIAEKYYKEHKWSKAVMQQRQKEKVLFRVKKYEQA